MQRLENVEKELDKLRDKLQELQIENATTLTEKKHILEQLNIIDRNIEEFGIALTENMQNLQAEIHEKINKLEKDLKKDMKTLEETQNLKCENHRQAFKIQLTENKLKTTIKVIAWGLGFGISFVAGLFSSYLKKLFGW